jgi:predicted enzyme related to lactoylglutathione lyase
MGHPVVHFEVVGKDGEGLRSYYADLFGWEIDADNPLGSGVITREGNVDADGKGIGGGVGGSPPGYEGHVTFDVEVPDVEAALARAEELGGTRLMGPDPIPGTDVEIGQLQDPEGHMIGVMRTVPS